MEWQIGWVDIAMVAVMVVSVLVGAARGFTFEVLSLAGWFAAWFAAIWVGPLLAPHLPVGEVGSTLNRGIAYASVFLVVLVLWSLAARAVASLIGKTPLRPLDRLLGSLFGLVRGVLVLMAVVTLVGWSSLAQSDAWQASRGAVWLNAGLAELLPWLAPAAAELPGAPAANRV